MVAVGEKKSVEQRMDLAVAEADPVGGMPQAFSTAARDMVAAGASPHEAMQVTGHRSLAMFERYNIKTTREAAKALVAREALLRAQG